MSGIFKARTNRILMNRGDSASFPLEISYPDGRQFVPDESIGEAVTFTVRKGPKAENFPVLIQKNVEGTRIEIEPEDTRELEYGSFLFDVEVIWQDGEELETKTVIIGQFCVLTEVT